MRSPGRIRLQVTDDRFLNVLAAAEVGGFGLEVEKPDAHDRAGVSGGRDVGFDHAGGPGLGGDRGCGRQQERHDERR